MGTAWNPGTRASAGWVEFPEDGEQLDHDLDRWGVRNLRRRNGTSAAALAAEKAPVATPILAVDFAIVTRGQIFVELPPGEFTSEEPIVVF